MRRTPFRFCTCHTSSPSFAHVHIPTPFCACPTYLNRFSDCRTCLSHYIDLHTYLSRFCDCHTRLSNLAHVTNAFSVLVPLTRHANLPFMHLPRMPIPFRAHIHPVCPCHTRLVCFCTFHASQRTPALSIPILFLSLSSRFHTSISMILV